MSLNRTPVTVHCNVSCHQAKTGLVRVNDSNRGSLTVRLVLTLECLKLQKQDNHQSSSSSSSEDTVDNYQPSPNYYVKICFFFSLPNTYTIASRHRLSALWRLQLVVCDFRPKTKILFLKIDFLSYIFDNFLICNWLLL